MEFTGDTGMNIEQIVDKLKTLPSEKQQEVLDFVEFLQTKTLQEEVKSQDQKSPASVLTLAQKYIGCVEGPGDLSTNKKYMDGYGS